MEHYHTSTLWGGPCVDMRIESTYNVYTYMFNVYPQKQTVLSLCLTHFYQDEPILITGNHLYTLSAYTYIDCICILY